MSKKHATIIGIALLTGLIVTASTLMYTQKKTIQIYNDCKGICAMWVSRDVESVTRGFPFEIISADQNGADKVRVSPRGALKNWLLYSVIIFVILQLWQYRPKQQ